MSLFSRKPKQRLVPISINKYATPTLENGECPFSVGVMNLTKAEADRLSEFAVQLQADRTITATEMGEREKRVNLNIGNSPAYSNMVGDVEANLKREIERVKSERACKRAARNAYDAPGFANGGPVPAKDKMEAIGQALKAGMISADAAAQAMKEFGAIVGDGSYDYGGDPDGLLQFPMNRDSVLAAAQEKIRREAIADIQRVERERKAIEDAKPRNRFSGLDIE